MSLMTRSQRDRPFDAVLLIAFGGPRGPEEVRPFLQQVLRGRRVPAARIEEVVHHYAQFGGRSPLAELTARQAAGLAERLRARGMDLPVYVGMRNWHPFLVDTLWELAGAGVRRVLGFIMAPHASYPSCGQYRQAVLEARAEIVRRGRPDVQVIYADPWYAHEGFIAANAAHVRQALAALPSSLSPRARLVFTAHSIPKAMAEASQYTQQLLTSARLVAAAVGIDDWALVYQSRSGRPEEPWLEPDVCDYLRREHARGLAAVVLCPIGFVADHIEVLYDLDHEAAALCRSLGLPMARADTVNVNPHFLDMMAAVVVAAWERYRHGLPLPLAAPPPARLSG